MQRERRLKLKVIRQANRLEEIEKTMGHIVNSLSEGKLPEGLFLDKENKKLVIKTIGY